MIYLKMRSDSKRDGVKREHVIFTQARQGRGRGGGGGGGGRGRFEKMCVPGYALASPHSRIFTFVSVGSDPGSYVFTSTTV